MDRHSGQLDELDVGGILAFAERVLPRAADLWVQASLEQQQRFQQLLFPEGISFDGNGFVRTAVTAPAFSYLRRRGQMKVWWTRTAPVEPTGELGAPDRGPEAVGIDSELRPPSSNPVPPTLILAVVEALQLQLHRCALAAPESAFCNHLNVVNTSRP
jgi:hypothetical protein